MHRFCCLLMLLPLGACAQEVSLDKLKLPPGFHIEVYADQLPEARSLALSSAGTLFVGTMSDGNVYALKDTDGDKRADQVFTVAEDLFLPNGVALRDGSLYVAEVNRLLRFDDIEDRLASPPEPSVIYDDLPKNRHHGWKYIAFGPDGRLYVPVGAPCNVCDKPAPFASLLRMNADGSGREVFARGIRNTVGFTWHPRTADLWFTDNGRDLLGDDVPPCELNRADRPGMHFGYPYVHGVDILDPEFGTGHDARDYTAPARPLGAHVAPLGLQFYTGDMFPESYRRLFVAEHGSWNRSKKVGYRVMMATIDETGQVTAYEPFIEGWLEDQENWGRPVDFEVMDDGSLLVSDDQTGIIYRVTYR